MLRSPHSARSPLAAQPSYSARALEHTSLNTRQVAWLMYNILSDALRSAPRGSLFTCRSAFGGFGLYRRHKFVGVRYDGALTQTASDAEGAQVVRCS